MSKIKKAYSAICSIEPYGQKTEGQLQELNRNVANLSQQVEELMRRTSILLGNSYDMTYANFFHDSVKNSKWFDSPLSLSGWAIGYNFAYILFKTLENMKPKSILELGLGQSTKIINDYASKFDKVKHIVVEHDTDWIDFFEKETKLSANTKVEVIECYKKKHEDVELNAYKDIAKRLEKEKFDLIVIDGPIGSGKEYSRMDVLDLIPQNLNKSFVILLDDCNRIGELNTAKMLEEKLNENGIEFSSSFDYKGRTNVYVCTSKDFDFLCHI